MNCLLTFPGRSSLKYYTSPQIPDNCTSKLKIIIYFIFFSLHSSLYPRPIELILERKVLQTFEDSNKIEKIVTKGNPDFIPEVSFSKIFTSPELRSTQSLLFRFTENSRFIPIEYFFEEPIYIQDYVSKIEFHIYSSSRGGEIYFFLEDGLSETHKILVSNIKFTGWKKIQIPLQKFYQNDIIFRENRKMKCRGFLISPPKASETGNEFLIAIDDIIVYSLPKYKVVP